MAVMNTAPGGAGSSLAQRAFTNMGASGPRTLVSVYPLDQELKLNHEGSKIYKMEGAPKGEHRTLTVVDTFAACKNFANDQLYPAPVPASVVADNLVQSWTRGRVGTETGLGPGVLVCVGTEPTQSEIAAVISKQVAYFTHLVNDADAKYAREGARNITADHRLAADWLGVKDRKWAQDMAPASNKPCPACGEEIKSVAVICRHCNTNIPKFLAEESGVKSTPKTPKV